jgi:hypothetical protein
MGRIPPKPEDFQRAVRLRIFEEDRELRDQLAQASMTAAMAADPSFMESEDRITLAASRFYLLADQMVRARRRVEGACGQQNEH